MNSCLYSSPRKNAVLAGATVSRAAPVLLALYAGFVNQCRDFCASGAEDAESVLVQYTRLFVIVNTVDMLFCWSLLCLCVREGSPTDTAAERAVHDKNVSDSESMQYFVVSSWVEMLFVGVYGFVCLAIVRRGCADGPVGDGFCRTITAVLAACATAWSICVCLLHAKMQGTAALPDGARQAYRFAPR